ncbi:MAG: hypothetical protein NTV97_04265 [Alphaproteobacteria bacterium]|nr:hypothetical protein [Alphaproteobacteria bacterium]
MRSAALALVLMATASAAAADERDFLQKGQAAYYSLQREGLAEFARSALPNWDLMLASLFRTDPDVGKRTHAMLSSQRFALTVGVGKRPKIAFLGGAAAGNAQQAQGLEKIKSGLDQALTGLFDIWSPFVLTEPFPGPSTAVDLVEQPLFTETPRGLLLSAYQAGYRTLPAGEVSQLQVRIDYQQVDGFDLPKTLALGGSQGGHPFLMEVALAECKVTRR